ncbi:M20 family metallo-hydrolase [Lentibacillus jeotgali]|uniref:M20 family metallo-hydrolase n=1 Tax=Lentibacillus jeotgali TaxID=558169 RepID=UPI00026283ED|nr:M20 family metallo-hydrolase [Lentibacillus jeotgali]
MQKLKIDINRVKYNLENVAQVYNSGEDGYTRLAFSKEEDQAIDWVAEELKSYGARVRKDAVGNLYGRIGPEDAPVIAFGSHLDTVKNGGLFDGAVGVFTGLECIRALKEQNFDSNMAYELVCFKGEEGNPLGGTFGSRTVTGQINPEAFDEKLLKSLEVSEQDIRNAMDTLPEYKAFIEMHIEQGTVLENNDNRTGIVTNIAGISRTHIKVIGTPGHSGTMPMNSRKDALVNASEIVLHIHKGAKKVKDGTVATVGQLDVMPNLATVIPGTVELTFEVRSGSQERIDAFEKEMLDWVTANYDVEILPGVKKKASSLSPEVRALLNRAANTLGLPVMEMVSGANHDANSLTNHTEVGMLFVPSIDGISHNPEENSYWEDIANAADIMLQALMMYREE